MHGGNEGLHVANALTMETLTKSEQGEEVRHATHATDLFEQLS